MPYGTQDSVAITEATNYYQSYLFSYDAEAQMKIKHRIKDLTWKMFFLLDEAIYF